MHREQAGMIGIPTKPLAPRPERRANRQQRRKFQRAELRTVRLSNLPRAQRLPTVRRKPSLE